MASRPYFRQFENKTPPFFPAMDPFRAQLWQFLAGLTIGLSLWYLHWRWTASLNPDAIVFSVAVAAAETLFFLGTLLFFHDIWAEGDTPQKPAPNTPSEVGITREGDLSVDVFLTTYDEEPAVVIPSIVAAQKLQAPAGVSVQTWLLDDGNRPEFAAIAQRFGIGYLGRSENTGFKAGNLRNALLNTTGDFIVICDADTRVFTDFLMNTLGYFRDPRVAWVQTPHWFYDLPQGTGWRDWVRRRSPRYLPETVQNGLAALAQMAFGRATVGADPFMSEPALFFDVIQRRRNRNGASFCCGAGSIHRREALFEAALKQVSSGLRDTRAKSGAAAPLSTASLQPFRFHVSEDIYTSILLHSDPKRSWISVYHPQVESRMLSPWSIDAWATQKLKYAGGTFDIMFRDNPVFRPGMPWRAKLHYAATFWSYLSVLWVPVMLLAPVLSMLTGLAPVKAYSAEFFAHILPVLIISELAMITACKGYDINLGRVMNIGGLPILFRALSQVLRGQRPRFPATPKTPIFNGMDLKRVMPNIVLLGLLIVAATYGTAAFFLGVQGYTIPFVVVNLFWLLWNGLSQIRVISLAFWRPPEQTVPSPKRGSVNEPA